ncbi:hypothetical protein GmHk_05G013363 [Glycine max]|nr:hypothetical protein GmHk_05G013363 [Glycine max]
MATPPNSPPPTGAASHSPSTLKRTRKATRLRSLATRPVGVERSLIHVDPEIEKVDGPHRKKLRTYLRIVARDKMDVTYENWKQVPTAQKDLIWEDIHSTRTVSMTLYAKSTTLARRSGPNFVRVAETLRGSAPHMLSRGGYEFLKNKLLEEKKKKQLAKAAKSGSTHTVIDPLSPIRRHVKWKMNHTKKAGQMTSETTKEIANKIMQSQGLALPPEPDVGPLACHVSTKESYVDPSGNNPDIVKVGVEEVRDEDAPIPVPTEEVKLVGQTLNTFIALLTHLAKRLSEQVEPADRPDHDVDDPQYLMTLTIPQFFLKLLQLMWDATVFRVFNDNFPLYIKQEDMSEIAHSGQCLSIFVIKLWILHMTEKNMRAGNVDVYGFLEPQSIQRSGQSQFE